MAQQPDYQRLATSLTAAGQALMSVSQECALLANVLLVNNDQAIIARIDTLYREMRGMRDELREVRNELHEFRGEVHDRFDIRYCVLLYAFELCGLMILVNQTQMHDFITRKSITPKHHSILSKPVIMPLYQDSLSMVKLCPTYRVGNIFLSILQVQIY